MIDPAQRIDALLDVRVRDGVIAEIGEHLGVESGEQCFDVAGAFVAPGFIDMHVHLREPGNPEKETIATGLAAAVAGGFTAVAAMPNTNPAMDTPERVRWVSDTAERLRLARVHPIATITLAREGLQPADYPALKDAGAVACSDDGNTVASAIVQTTAALRAREAGLRFITHCEPEEEIVARDAAIATATRLPWHIAHVSSRAALRVIDDAKQLGLDFTCEATPHHLAFSHEETQKRGLKTRVHPPLRDRKDVMALRAAVFNGTIDAFASDHAPHPDDASPGFSGLEVAVGGYAYALPSLPPAHYVALLSTNPARILGVPGGTLAIGAPADITILADREWTVDPKAFYSKGRATPFAGLKLPRRAIATIVRGALVMEEGRVAAPALK